MTARFKKIAAYFISISLAVSLLYLALSGVDIAELKGALNNAAYIWAVPLVFILLLSHALRAWRWQILLDALPDRQHKGELQSISFKTAFLSLFIGYFVNLLAPRLGEVARAGTLAKQQHLRFSGVFGTVVAERVFDVLILLLGIGSLSFLFYDQFLFLQESILSPLLAVNPGASFAWVAFGLTGAGAVCYIALRTFKTSQSSRLLNLRRRFISIVKSFKDGIMTLLHAPKRTALILSTLAMWLCYVVLAYMTFLMLDMHATYNLGFTAAWSIMIFGAIGFAVPSPGGTGSFHYIAKIALVNLYFVDEATAAAYGLLSHGIQTLVYIVIGVFALFIQGTTLKSIRTTALDVD